MKIKPNHVLINGQEYKVENHEPKLFTVPMGEVAKTVFREKADDLNYLGYWFVKDAPAFVWKSNNPDRSLGHKEYVVLKHRYNPMLDQQDMIIMGYDFEEMKKLSVIDAALCHHCKTICWSLTRHDFHGCECKEDNKAICVDGGTDYLRMVFGKEANYEIVQLDFLTKMVNANKKENKDERKIA